MQAETTFNKLNKKYGYNGETYKVVTEDGYVLTLFRVLQKDGGVGQRGPVLLFPALRKAPENVMLLGPKSQVYSLSDQGFDVWLMNARGGKYSKAHETLDPDKDPEFWDFSYDDLPKDIHSIIDYVIKNTGIDKISIVTYSVSAAATLIAMAEDPEWFKERINLSAFLAPFVLTSNLNENGLAKELE